jgi:malonyl-CoA O-methyltransferase
MLNINKISRNFSNKAQEYESGATMQKNVAKKLLSYTLEKLNSEPLQILELGCGTGFLTEELIKHYPKAQIIAIDIAPNMLGVAKDKFASNKNISFLQSDIRDIEKIDGKFDLIISGLSFQWLEDELPSIIRKIKTKLTSNGNIIFSTLLNKTFEELQTAFNKSKSEYPGPKLYQRDELLNLLSPKDWIEEFYYENYKTPMEFLKQIKSTGAVNPNTDFVSTSTMRMVIKRLGEQKNSNNKLKVTYHLLFCLI